jgi:hypothetical protein
LLLLPEQQLRQQGQQLELQERRVEWLAVPQERWWVMRELQGLQALLEQRSARELVRTQKEPK